MIDALARVIERGLMHARGPWARLVNHAHFPTIARVFFVLVVAGMSVTPVLNAWNRPHDNKDYGLWDQVGMLVRLGEPLYPSEPGAELPYMYPPTPAVVLFAPAGLFGSVGLVLILIALTAWAWRSCLHWCERASGLVDPADRAAVSAIGMLISAPYAFDCFLLGQINLILLGIMLAGYEWLRTGRGVIGGAVLASAAAFKAFPLLIVGWLVYRRQWSALVGYALSLVTLVLIVPGMVRGFDRNWSELKIWSGSMIAGEVSADRPTNRADTALTYRNQSLWALAQRTLRDIPAGDESFLADKLGLSLPARPLHPGGAMIRPFFINVAHLSSQQTTLVVLGACVLMGAVFVLCTRRVGPFGASGAMEYAVVLVFVALLPPKAWTYFFCWLMPVFALLYARMLTSPPGAQGRRLAALLGVACVLTLAVTQNVDHLPQALGVTTLGAIALIVLGARAVGKDGAARLST